MGARWSLLAGCAMLLAFSAEGVAAASDEMKAARSAVDSTMSGRPLTVAIEAKPLRCNPQSELCYSNHYPRLYWYRDPAPRHACRTVMSPRRTPKIALSDEGEVPFAPAAVFARSANPQDAWIDWRGVTSVQAEARTVVLTTPLNAYRVTFSFPRVEAATAAAAVFERLRVACDDGPGPVTDLLQAHRVAVATLQRHLVSAAFNSRRLGREEFAENWRVVRFQKFEGGMCARGALRGTSDGKPFVAILPSLVTHSVARSGKTVSIIPLSESPAPEERLQLEMDSAVAAQRLAEGLDYVRNWCATQYDERKFYPRVL